MRESVADFYGSGNQAEGLNDVGYCLGKEFVRYPEVAGLAATDIALLPRQRIRQLVELYLVAETAR